MKRNSKYIVWAALSVLMMSSSCTKKFDLYNTNLGNATDELLGGDNVNITAFYAQIQKNVIPIGNDGTSEINSYQLAENLQADSWAGYFGVTNTFGGPNNTTYFLKPNWIPEAFNNLTKKVLPAYQKFKDGYAASPDNISVAAAYAIADIMKVFAVSRTTDMYGPLPYLKAGASTLSTPYDSQEAIYDSFFTDLDKDVEILNRFLVQSGVSKLNVTTDLVYTGDYAKWLKFANSLRLRLAMRISKVKPALAKTEAEKAVNELHGLITDNADNAIVNQGQLNFRTLNPINYVAVNYQDTRVGATLESLLKGYSDPRLPKMFNEAASGGYHGIRSGINVGAFREDYIKQCSIPKIDLSAGMNWFVAAETYFLLAEGATKGWNMGGEAKGFYEKGVQTSFDMYAAGSAESYLKDDKRTAAPYVDVVNASNSISSGSNYLSKCTIKWDEGATADQKLEKIITQKYIANFPDGQEAWSDFRRTNYPKIFPVVVNDSQGAISTDIQIRRVIYPTGESQSNPTGYSQALSFLGGPDNGGTRLWWDTK